MTTKKKALFKFQPFSQKQRMLLNWWCDDSPVKSYNGIVADGAIRSGKTIAMSLGYVLWAMSSFDNQNFGLCGKTIGSFRRNVLFWLKLMLFGRGYKVKEARADNCIIVTDKVTKTVNTFYIFGGKDERSQDLIQGITLAGVFFDEVALMPESFVNQATGRCSVEGSKFWFNCNPDSPSHYFLKEWIHKRHEKKLLYLSFTMDDNLSLTNEVKERYKSMYTGVFYERFIKGLWVMAEGLLFPQFADNPGRWEIEKLPKFMMVNIGVDIGGTKSHTAMLVTGITSGYQEIITFKERHIKHSKGTVDIDKIGNVLIDLIKECQSQGYLIKYVFVDNAEQVIINSLFKAVRVSQLPTTVLECKKFEGRTRIQIYNLLLNTHRMRFKQCPKLKDSLSTARYDEKKLVDTILDDFSSDIDTFDAHFYSFSYYFSNLGLVVKG